MGFKPSAQTPQEVLGPLGYPSNPWTLIVVCHTIILEMKGEKKKNIPETWLFLSQIALLSEIEPFCLFHLHEESHGNAQIFL